MEDQECTSLRFQDKRRLTRKEREQLEAHGHARAGLADNRAHLARGKTDPGRYIMVTGRQVHCPRPKLFHDRSIVLEGAALSYMRLAPNDIRAELLALQAWHNTGDLQRVFAYFRNYLQIVCERSHVRAKESLQCCAVEDALIAWLFGHSSAPMMRLARRRLHKHLEIHGLRWLRNTVEQKLRSCIDEAYKLKRETLTKHERTIKIGILDLRAPEFIADTANPTPRDSRLAA